MVVFLLLCLVVGICGWGTIFSVLGWIIFIIGTLLTLSSVSFETILLTIGIIILIFGILGLIYDKESRKQKDEWFMLYAFILIVGISIGAIAVSYKIEYSQKINHSIALENVTFKKSKKGITPKITFVNKSKKAIDEIKFSISNDITYINESIELSWNPDELIESGDTITAIWNNGINNDFASYDVELEQITILYDNKSVTIINKDEGEHELQGWDFQYRIDK